MARKAGKKKAAGARKRAKGATKRRAPSKARATKKRTSKSKASADEAPVRNRGGRKPGRWELCHPDEIRAFRKDHSLSRARLAKQLGVSTTSIQNWENGRVASPKIQARLRALIDGKPLPQDGLEQSIRAARTTNKASAIQRGVETSQTAISTTGEIVCAYIRTSKNLKPEQLVELVREVRQALQY